MVNLVALKLEKTQRFICYRNEKPQRAHYKFVIEKRTQYGADDSLYIGNHVKEFLYQTISTHLNKGSFAQWFWFEPSTMLDHACQNSR